MQLTVCYIGFGFSDYWFSNAIYTVSVPNILSSVSKKINTRTVAKTTTITTKTTINTLDRKKSTTAVDEGSKDGSPENTNQQSSTKNQSSLSRSLQNDDNSDSTQKLNPDLLITTMTKSISSDAIETDAFGSTITVVNVVYQVEIIEQEVDGGVTLGYTKINDKIIASISYSNGDISYLVTSAAKSTISLYSITVIPRP
ncbi:hypothetical protein AYI69_g975 [Smittium culicis]|uniref:Uncharacterized protein n=1 Tax=Smittium culicis TaxID=133412 RepID=A0A1R1YRL5_9FUNG|nr:hypothetical protein AYI69_g975 [Smittium culicis]